MRAGDVLLNRFWNDERGSTLSVELILITTILGIGTITGLTTVRDQVTFELADLATAFGQVNQSYSLGAVTGTNFSFAGSLFADTTDFCDDTSSNGTDPSDAGTACVALIDADAE